LALALADARVRSPTSAPEVILPAYGCPDLVSASIHAGVYPRLVDTAPGGLWGYDLDALEAAVSASCVAILAVNLLGTGDQAQELRKIAAARGIALIQDSAQYLPCEFPAVWVGDYVVLSFGRGKPLNLLGGGALLHSPHRAEFIAAIESRASTDLMETPGLAALGALAFNVATHPAAYGLARRLMGSSLGITRYKPLRQVRLGSPRKIAQIERGLAGYAARAGYDASIWNEVCAGWTRWGIELLACLSATRPTNVRLRLAMLAPDGRTRDAIVNRLDERGLGATAMYGATMEQLAGIPAEVATQGPFPNAANLASRLFTLPTHSCVSSALLRETDRLLTQLLRH
jgi:dTDP-4-amino-4,6-dideoxygalactose transaminase